MLWLAAMRHPRRARREWIGIAAVLIGSLGWADASMYGERIKAHDLDPQFLCELRLSDYGQNNSRFVIALLAGRSCDTDPAYRKSPCLESATRIDNDEIRYLNGDDPASLRRHCALAKRLERSEMGLTNSIYSDGVHREYVRTSVTCDEDRPVGVRIEGGADAENRRVVTCALPAYFRQ